MPSENDFGQYTVEQLNAMLKSEFISPQRAHLISQEIRSRKRFSASDALSEKDSSVAGSSSIESRDSRTVALAHPPVTRDVLGKLRTFRWSISLGASCICGFVFGALRTPDTTGDPAFLFGVFLGYSTIYGLLCWFVFHALIGNKYSAEKGWIALFAIVIAIGSGCYLGYLRHNRAEKQAFLELRRSYTALAAKDETASSSQLPSVERHMELPLPNDDLGRLILFLKQMMTEIAQQRSSYQAELAAIGWDSILDSNRLEQDKNLTESEFMIRRATQIVLKYKALSSKLLEDARNKVLAMNVSQKNRDDILRGFDKSMVVSQPDLDILWKTEEESVAEYKKIISLLMDNSGSWEIVDNQIVFANSDRAKTFNSYLARIDELLIQQEKIGKRNRERTKKILMQFGDGILSGKLDNAFV